ncbi:hypothetical protein KAR91_71645, partial [Candidatus Pacearchaeota archaeon]|nr:hypothetical protein [Candidatus Pacearchaeota archaeon]
MKTIIDSKQAERLKEVCEKHNVKLPFFVSSEYHLLHKSDCRKINFYQIFKELPYQIYCDSKLYDLVIV